MAVERRRALKEERRRAIDWQIMVGNHLELANVYPVAGCPNHANCDVPDNLFCCQLATLCSRCCHMSC